MLSDVTVERLESETLQIRWTRETGHGPVIIHAGRTPETIDRSEALAEIQDRDRAEIAGLDPDARYYFEVRTAGGPGIITAERRLPLKGSVNFRDLGGYETRDGRRVKWGQVFRSDSLARLSYRDQAYIARLGLKLVVDFRTPAEVEKGADRLPEDGSVEYLQLPIVHGEFDPAAATASLMKGDISWLTEDFMISRYIRKIDEFPAAWGAVINRLVRPDSRPMLFHCTGGKDRAGTMAALILLALGVPEETVVYDHGLSNVYIAGVLERIYKEIRKLDIDPESVASYFTAPREGIMAQLEHLKDRYGSAERYLIENGGVSEETLASLKDQLLE
ncbi:MAG: tyrosine-protein phosphatase [Proteobacteria bacterium]|nr:tyrosine-protein phosphatase [Pseudomonadota bacterium]